MPLFLGFCRHLVVTCGCYSVYAGVISGNNIQKMTTFYCNLYSSFLPQSEEPNTFLLPVQERINIPFFPEHQKDAGVRTGAHLVLMGLLFPPPSTTSAFGFQILQLWESKGSEDVFR